MKGWVGLVGWPVADFLPILVVTHQLQVERRTGKVRRPETDVLPLCHATNSQGCKILKCVTWPWPHRFRGHSRSPAISLFDRAHMTSYSTLMDNCLSCNVFEIQPAICRKSPIITHPPAFGAYVPPPSPQFSQNQKDRRSRAIIKWICLCLLSLRW